MADSVYVKTYRCTTPDCEYSWQFSGDAVTASPHDMSVDQVRQQFPERKFWGLLPGKCPSCWLKGQSGDLYLETDTEGMAIIHVSTDDDLSQKTTDETDANGVAVMEQVGERETVGIVDGKPAVVSEPIYRPKQRELTKAELAALKAQRDQSLDVLEQVAVQELK